MEEKRSVMSLLQTFREWFGRRTPIKDIQTALDIRPAISQELIDCTELWWSCYIGEAQWCGEQPDGSIVTSLRIEQSVVRELADIVTNEMTASTDNDHLNELLSQALSELPSELQKGLATGAMVIKPLGAGGGVQFVPQNEFIPVEYDQKRRLRKVVFPEVRKIGEYWYTRLEYHSIEDGLLTISNTAYRSGQKDVLGAQISLTDVDVWSKLPEQKTYNTDRPVFGYYRNPLPNTIDSSPGGVSAFDAALSTISLADRQFSRIDYEFDSARRRIMVDEQGVKNVNGRTVLGGDVFTPVDIENLFKDFTPEVRQADFIAGLNEYKREIEFQCGLSYGDISDPQSVDKTATEIKSAKQRKYNTVTAIQKNLRTCIEDFLYAIAFWEAQTTSGYTLTCDFKDSILTDEETERRQDIQDVSMGVMSKLEYRMKWYGEDEKAAKSNLPAPAEVIP
jgi:A118 family predicted phage portal protein